MDIPGEMLGKQLKIGVGIWEESQTQICRFGVYNIAAIVETYEITWCCEGRNVGRSALALLLGSTSNKKSRDTQNALFLTNLSAYLTSLNFSSQLVLPFFTIPSFLPHAKCCKFLSFEFILPSFLFTSHYNCSSETSAFLSTLLTSPPASGRLPAYSILYCYTEMI